MKNPLLQKERRPTRSLRGGEWDRDPNRSRVSHRLHFNLHIYRGYSYGFRIFRSKEKL